ncbi:YdeI/OmpD-associated family protein [Chitinophaga rhizosphaerae]|uniref:YdeI/OmpD-associated family protein n=1 Tax=Chitinophaga rhizosphaerae TaxID=1864947 RepID=UPI000F7FC99F|nr:DUF1801 domain-containing protein [Chitinophaga rhizosphaerae]
MAHIVTNPKVDAFIGREDKWQEAFESLRDILLDCQLGETLKWGVPCYTYQNVNVVLMHGFKDYCALLFFKGSLLPDPNGLLVQQTENVQVGRQLRFTNAKDIRKLKAVIRNYVQDAIQVEAQGLEPQYKKVAEFAVAEEFQVKLDKSAALRKAFEALTPGRQRGYLLYFAAAKQAKTRAARVEKYIPQIMDGKGLDD